MSGIDQDELRFLHLATTNLGGAGIAAERVHRSLTAAGHASCMLVHRGKSDLQGMQVLETKSSALSLSLSKAWYSLTTDEKYYFRDQRWSLPSGRRVLDAARDAQPDIILAHFTTGFLSFDALAKVHEVTGSPVMFYLMDMGPLTGGCHFAWDCAGYEQDCRRCPALSLHNFREVASTTLSAKQVALTKMPHIVLAGSHWLAEQARRSALFSQSQSHVLPLSVDPTQFSPVDRNPALAELGLELWRKTFFFGSRLREQQRKGLPQVREALARLAMLTPPKSLPNLLVAGDGPDFSEFQNLGFPVRSLGMVDLDTLARCYAASDFFVSPSVEDSGPVMINEAVMSGTPVVAYKIGVAPDFVREGHTGELAHEVGDSQALATAMSRALDWSDNNLTAAREKLRQFALRQLTPDAQATRLVGLGADLCGRNERNS